LVAEFGLTEQSGKERHLLIRHLATRFRIGQCQRAEQSQAVDDRGQFDGAGDRIALRVERQMD